MKGTGRRLDGLAFVAPFLLFYTVLLIFPLLRGLLLSFHNADLFGGQTFIGLGNYARLAGDPVFHQALRNTLVLTAIIVPVLTALSLALALALNKRSPSAAFFRGLFFSSSVLSVTIVTLIWRFVLTPDAGLLAEASEALGQEPLPFLSDPRLTLIALALTTIWWSIGLPMMLFLAGLQQMPEDMYDAAALDGAGKWTTFRRITLPALRRTTVLVIMLQTAAQLQLFGQAQLLTAGGPGGASRPVVLFIFEVAFVRWELGYAQAAAQSLFVMILLVTLVQYRASSSKGER